jgi:hypothetical protein
MSLRDFFNRDDEPSTSRVRPRLRPVGGNAQENDGTSGKGGGQPAEPTYDVNAPDWKKQVASFNKKGGKNNDGRLGYGYVDTETGIEVPWYIDMINGGGANAAGDTFVSPFEGTVAGLPAQAVTGGLNAMGIAPYGSNRPRYFMPMEAARVDAEGKPVQVDLGPAPSSSGSSAVNPAVNKSLLGIPNSMTDDDMGLPTGPVPPTSAQPMSSFLTRYPSRISPEQYDQVYNDPIAPQGNRGGDGSDAEMSRLKFRRAAVIGNKPVPQDDMTAILSFGGGERSTLPAMTPPSNGVGGVPSGPDMTAPEAMTMFTAQMNTVPEMVRGTRIEEMYRKYLLSGNTGTFGQFTGAQP